jgi:hypothetical protein
VQGKPVIPLCDLANLYDQFVVLFQNTGLLDEHLTLSFGNGEYPVLALITINLDLKTPIQEPGLDALGRDLTHAFQWDVHFNVFLLIQERVFGDGLEHFLLFLLLYDGLDCLVKGKHVRVVLLDQVADEIL